MTVRYLAYKDGKYERRTDGEDQMVAAMTEALEQKGDPWAVEHAVTAFEALQEWMSDNELVFYQP